MEFVRKILMYKSMVGFLEVEKQSTKIDLAYREDSCVYRNDIHGYGDILLCKSDQPALEQTAYE
jgi:hypothetical protein